MDRKATNKAMYDYVISIIDTDGYDVTANTDKEKIQFVWNTFNKEKRYNISSVGEQNAFVEWLQGLPSSFNVDFENYRIVELGKKFGFLNENATERQEDKFIESWWARVYMAFRAAAKKNKVDLVKQMAKGGEVSKESDEIKKLRAVVNSPNIGEGLKAKAQARIDMLEEKKGKSTPTKKQKAKVGKVMKEFKKGELTSHGKTVKKKKQAVAIALSEAGLSKKKKSGETAMQYAKRTRKSGESWKDAVKRASKEMKNGGKPVAKKIKKTPKKSTPVLKKIKRTAKKAKPTTASRTIKRVKYLNGSTSKGVDKKVSAMPPGKRISKSKRSYYEYRANRADLNAKKKL